jgi:hypothetical protein
MVLHNSQPAPAVACVANLRKKNGNHNGARDACRYATAMYALLLFAPLL